MSQVTLMRQIKTQAIVVELESSDLSRGAYRIYIYAFSCRPRIYVLFALPTNCYRVFEDESAAVELMPNSSKTVEKIVIPMYHPEALFRFRRSYVNRGVLQDKHIALAVSLS